MRAIEKTREEINEFVRNYKGNLHTFEDFEAAFAVFEQIQINSTTLATTALCPKPLTLVMKLSQRLPKQGWISKRASVELSFFDDALVEADEEVLERLRRSLTSLLPFVRLKLKSSLLGS